MKSKLGLAVGLLALAIVVPASGQPQPGQPQPGQPQPGQPRPIQMQPGQPGQPQPIQMQPGQPGQQGRRPLQPGQQPRPIQPGQRMPPGHPPIAPPAPPAEEASGHDAHGHCPGHGPTDPPGHINWYQGLLGVNNEKALSPSGLDRLLYRYHNEKDECDAKNQEPPVLALVINFAVLLLLFIKFGKKPIVEGLAARKKGIMLDIENADELKRDAEARLKKYEKQHANIEERRRELREEHSAQLAAEQKRILADAEERKTRLLRDAELRVTQELRAAQDEAVKVAVETAIKAAEDLLRKRVTEADQSRIADEYLKGLAGAVTTTSATRGAP